MFYFITVNVYFNLVQENGVSSIALKTPLSVSESSYDRLVDQSSSAYLVTVEVRDSGNPPKVYSKQLNIIVSCKFCFLEMSLLLKAKPSYCYRKQSCIAVLSFMRFLSLKK